MAKSNEEGFWDSIAKRKVNYYTDCFGTKFKATSKFGFRVTVKK